MSGAQVNISLDELDELRNKLSRTHEANGKLSERIKELEVATAGDRADELLAIIDQATTVLQFGVANLDPATVRGWPWEALIAFADGVEKMPGVGDMEREMAVDLRAFARDCELHEIERATRPAKVEMPLPAPSEDEADSPSPPA